MAQSDVPTREPASTSDSTHTSLWQRFFKRDNGVSGASCPTDGASANANGHGPDRDDDDDDVRPGLIRRVSRKVVPGLPRTQTFKRQQSELRTRLEPVQPTSAERRAVSMDRRIHGSSRTSQCQSNPRTSAPDFLNHSFSSAPSLRSAPTSPVEEEAMLNSIDELTRPEAGRVEMQQAPDTASTADAQSMTTSQYDVMIHDELERIWILNLSMHFRDKSKREKFFVTYRERETLWRRVTISLDYRDAPENSLEMDLMRTKFQREKSAKIYEAIRDSLGDIQFYDTVTNLKLQTTEGRLHVHVVEDVNEIIHYPTVRMIQHMRCARIKERDIEFDSHMSGFVYKVRVNGEVLIKKEIPGPDTVDEFLYEINALNRLRYSNNVIQFYGVIVDDQEEYVKGLLISFAEQGALIDVIYDNDHSLPWSTREKWARQIVHGLSEIHEAGFVQGDFTLSNIVIDNDDNAKIIDINRRGCPVGWEPPEATPLIESNQRISMYIGVKSDLFQLGMVLWALATQEDEPESHDRPLRLGSDVAVPSWYRRIVETCLSEDPRLRVQALHLLSKFPDPTAEADDPYYRRNPPSISIDDGYSVQDYFIDGHPNGRPRIRTVQPPNDWSYVSFGHTYINPATGMSDEPYYYPTRGRSPPSPLPSNHDQCESPQYRNRFPAWSHNSYVDRPPSVSDVGPEEPEERRSVTPRTNRDSVVAADNLAPSSNINEPAEAQTEHEATTSLDAGPQAAPGAPNEMQDKVQDEIPDGDTPRTEIKDILSEPATVDTGERVESGHDDIPAEPAVTAQDAASHEDDIKRDEIPLGIAQDQGTTEPGVLPDSSDKETPRTPAPPDVTVHVTQEPAPDATERPVEEVVSPERPAIPDEPPRRPRSSGSNHSTTSPPHELPDDLKGIGAAYDQTNEEAIRGQGAIDDDFGILTTDATTAAEMGE